MEKNGTQALMVPGRLLLGLYFLLPGIAKFAVPESQIELMVRHGVPSPELLLPLAGMVNVLGALLLMSNRFVRFTALGFVIYILVVNVMLHDFWNFTGVEAAHETQNFVKNLGILAGLLVLAGASSWRMPTFSGLRQSDAAAA